MKLFEIERTTKDCNTIWFYRKRRDNGTKYHSRSVSFSWHRKIWKRNKIRPMYKITNNGAKKSNGDSCFDTSLYLGYAVFGYTNWSFNI